MPRPLRPWQERLWEQITRRGPDECWLWTGACDKQGYGVIGVKIDELWRYVHAHRMVMIDRDGWPTERLLVRHRCDNPPCCNPAHLRWGTHQDNVDDMIERGRTNYVSGERHGMWRGGTSKAYQRKQRRRTE